MIKGRGEMIFPSLKIFGDQDGTHWDILLTPEPADSKGKGSYQSQLISVSICGAYLTEQG